MFIQSVKDDNEALRSEFATIKTQFKEISCKFEADMKKRPSHQEVDAMIEDRLSTIEPGSQANTVSNILSEIDQRSKRANNIIIHGVSECTSDSREERIRHDLCVTTDILKTCDVKCDDVTVTKVIRVGPFDKDKKKRPIIATLSKPGTKGELFKNASKLRDNTSYKDTRVGNDLTKMERENEKKLYDQAKKMQEESGDQFRVRGPPWARKIIKVTPAEAPKPATKK